MEREFVPVRIGVMMVSNAPTTLDEATGKLVVTRLADAGHDVTGVEVIPNDHDRVRSQLESWIRDAEIDVVIAIAGIDTDATQAALTPLISRPLHGFSDLFRMLTYDEIGTGAMLVDVVAAECGATFVFVLPASKGAVGTALDRILLPQLDHRTRPRNLVMKMARHRVETLDTDVGVPPPPARAGRGTTIPPPIPRKRTPSVHGTPPMPVPVVRASDPEIAELDPGAPIDAGDRPALDPAVAKISYEEAIEESIERSIEATGAPLQVEALDDDHPSTVAAREHAQKSPADQAAAWVAAVEAAAIKVVERAAAARENRELADETETEAETAARPEPAESSEASSEASSEVAAAAEPVAEASTAAESLEVEAEPASEEELEADDEQTEPIEPAEILDERRAALVVDDEPRGKIEKATGPRTTKPDHPVADEDAVIVADELVDKPVAARRRRPTTAPPPIPRNRRPTDLPKPRALETDLPVFPAREQPHPPPPNGRVWVAIGGLAVVAAVVMIVLALGRHRGTIDAAPEPASSHPTEPPPAPTTAPVVDPSTASAPPTSPPIAPATVPTTPPTTSNNPGDIEMEPAVARKPPTHHVAPTHDTPTTDPASTDHGGTDHDGTDHTAVPADLTRAPTNPTSATETCDQVSCILNKYAKPCCAKFKPADTGSAGSGAGSAPPPPPPPPPVDPNAPPATLDRSQIRTGVERFRPQIIVCGEQHTTKGTVKLSVTVRPDGSVASATVTESPDPALGACVAAVMRKATFAKTQNGGSFGYPFVF